MDERGFTLVELLVVILIIGILAAIAAKRGEGPGAETHEQNAGAAGNRRDGH